MNKLSRALVDGCFTLIGVIYVIKNEYTRWTYDKSQR